MSVLCLLPEYEAALAGQDAAEDALQRITTANTTANASAAASRASSNASRAERQRLSGLFDLRQLRRSK